MNLKPCMALPLLLVACGGTKVSHVDLSVPDLTANADQAVACNYPSLSSATPASLVEDSTDMGPAFVGGTIANGTYLLTGLAQYAPSKLKDAGFPSMVKAAITINDAVITENTDSPIGPFAGTFSTENSALVAAVACPPGQSDIVWEYTATDTMLIVGLNSVDPIYEIFTKQ